MFYGPAGTGKTTTALALAATIFPKSQPNSSGAVLELNASDERGIDVVREQIKSFAETRSFAFAPAAASNGMIQNGPNPGFKIIILDECDAMTNAAQNALRRIMEKYVRNVRFIIICNYASQIIPALQSRCTRFRFAPIPLNALSDRLDQITKLEGYDDEIYILKFQM